MSRKLILSCAFVALSFTGCHKLHSLFSHKASPTPEPVANTEPAPSVAMPVPGPTAPITRTSNRNAVVIALCYHDIGDDKTRALNIPLDEFTKEMQALKDNGFTVIGMQDFLAWRRGEKAIPNKSALITIDDGWVSAYENAWPILKKYNYPFTLFIYINYIGTGGKSIRWDQLAEMRDAGVDIEPHTYSHSDLKKPGALVDKTTAALVAKDVAALGVDGWLHKEVIGSKQMLEKQLGIKANVFAYPFGIYDEKVRQLVKEAGYEAAFTVYGQQLHINSPYDLLGRYAIDSKSLKNFDDAVKMIGGGMGTNVPDTGPDEAQLAGASMITEPANGETIGSATPLIKANLATMGAFDPASVKMRLSGFGLVPAKYDAVTKTVTFQVTQKLKDTGYTVRSSTPPPPTPPRRAKNWETKWDFNYDPTGKNVGPAPTPALPPR